MSLLLILPLSLCPLQALMGKLRVWVAWGVGLTALLVLLAPQRVSSTIR